ncbi:MAG: hypothetical protein M3P34_01970 [Actinomycetota bacterium]|nr:hypothetical protein [Actinomycetota bacterium]
MAGVARVALGHHQPLPGAFDEGPALVGLEVVVMLAERIEKAEQGDLAGGPVDTVVVLQRTVTGEGVFDPTTIPHAWSVVSREGGNGFVITGRVRCRSRS